MQQQAIELRTFAFLDKMQPQVAAYMGTILSGSVPTVGQAELFIEVAPGIAVYEMADIALKTADVRPGAMGVERQFGILELHASSVQALRRAADAMLASIHLSEADGLPAEVISTEIITNVDPYQAQLINQARRGSLMVPGEAMLIIEVAPAGYALLAANEAEKAADITLISIITLGPAGRFIMSGTTSQLALAQEAALQAMRSVKGRAH